VGQAGAALGAATGQDLAAVGGSHSLAEAVDLGAMQLLGLIGTFRCHVETPPVSIPAVLAGGTYSTPPLSGRRSKHSSRVTATHTIVYRHFHILSIKTSISPKKTVFFCDLRAGFKMLCRYQSFNLYVVLRAGARRDIFLEFPLLYLE
jgi:hypothetical protein